MIDMEKEKVLSFTEAAKRLPKRRGGKRVHTATLYRWAQRGCKGVKLESIAVGGTKCTSLEAMQRFCDRITLGDPAITRTSSKRQRSSEKADQDLAKSGW